MQEKTAPNLRWFALASAVALALTGMPPHGLAAGDTDTPQTEATGEKTPGAAENTAAPKTAPKAASDEATPFMPSITVVGSKKKAKDLPGSGHYVDTEDIQNQSYDDVHRVLRRVPGVSLREEDGFGLFPNISLRGVAPGRSAKVTLMEDGVLTAPAPYADPSAYYSPTTGRMAGIEVLKGSSQIQYGPHTTGGVVNYLSTPIPRSYQARAKFTLGSFQEHRQHVHVGDTVGTGGGAWGYLVEVYNRDNEGFKTVDRTNLLGQTGQDTGFRKSDYTTKFSFEPDTNRYQRFEFKWGMTDLNANETYLGITDADFNADPYRRYAASSFDNITSLQHRVSLRHLIEVAGGTDITTTLYQNKFRRNWYKHGGGNALANNMISAAQLAADPTLTNLALFQGRADGNWTYTHNNRKYEGKGIQTAIRHTTGAHHLEFGIRYHEDFVRRFQHNVTYAVVSQSNNIAGPFITGVTVGAPGSNSNRIEEVHAWAFHLQDEIHAGRWKVTPGLRLELLDLSTEDYAKGDGTYSRNLTLLAPGIGATYKASDQWTLLGGVYRGVSPPDARGATNRKRDLPTTPATKKEDLDEETSLGIEIGGRYENAKTAFALEAILFFTRLNDLIVIDNIGAGATGESKNVGDVDANGLELSMQWDPAKAKGHGYSTPWRLALTYTDAQIGSGNSNNTTADDIFSCTLAGGCNGNDVPYIPQWQFNLGTGYEKDRVGLFVDANYVDDTWSTSDNVASTTDWHVGKIDSHFTVDLSAHYDLREGQKAVLNLHNLFDQEYIVQRHPHGPRPGLPFTLNLGMEFTF